MPHSRKRSLQLFRSFPESVRARVTEMLDTYGVECTSANAKRVQLAILKLSEGSEEKLREFVAWARDYRDVLFWAEHPDEARLDTHGKTGTNKKDVRKVGIKPPEGF